MTKRKLFFSSLISLCLLAPLSAHAGFWDDIKEKSAEAKEKLLTEENKEKAKEFAEDNKDKIADMVKKVSK
jgi:hypothetical protein